jgi:hypothetical protein
MSNVHAVLLDNKTIDSARQCYRLDANLKGYLVLTTVFGALGIVTHLVCLSLTRYFSC